MTAPDLDALEKRLRKAKDGQAYRSVRHRDHTFQVRENDIDASIALIAELKEARGLLKPFADRCDESVRPDDSDSDGLTVQTRHLRAARAFLARNGKGDLQKMQNNAPRNAPSRAKR